jgi:succinyl-CoA synthetase alpha subunit
MAIFADGSTRVVIQGITGRDGSFHARQMIDYGTRVVAGVTPGKGGQKFDDSVPIFDTMQEAVAESEANASVVYVPAAFAANAICEAADSGVDLIVCISEGIPVLDMLRATRYVREKSARLIGPNCPGMISAGEAKLGIIPGQIVEKGPVGVVSRSGTLTYEVVWALTRAGMGQSSCIGIGGGPVIGTNFIDCLDAFEKDPQTEAIVLIGEIGGTDEQNAACYIKENLSKPVIGFVAGQTAPPGRRMGHAGAIISGSSGTAEEKISTFKENGVEVAERPADMPEIVARALNA